MAVSHLLLHQNWTPVRPMKLLVEVPTNISKYIQDIYKISKINTKYQAAAGPAQGKGRAGPFCIYVVYFCIPLMYLDTFWYIVGIIFRKILNISKNTIFCGPCESDQVVSKRFEQHLCVKAVWCVVLCVAHRSDFALDCWVVCLLIEFVALFTDF